MFWHCCRNEADSLALARVAKGLAALNKKIARLECTVMTARDDLEAKLAEISGLVDAVGADTRRVLDELADVKVALDEAIANSDLSAAQAAADSIGAKLSELNALVPEPVEEPPTEEPPVEEPPVEEPPTEEPPVEEPPAETSPTEETPTI